MDLRTFNALFTRRQLQTLRRLDSPIRIQEFLDQLAYSTDPIYRSPRRVLDDRRAHCADGALFAAAALRRIGFPPLVTEMKTHNDDVHLLALYKQRRHWGAVSKSNFAGLRFREPIYRTLRELMLSYFEPYFFNLLGEKTLRGYTGPLDLQRFDRLDWMTRDEHLEDILNTLDHVRVYPLITPAMARALHPVDPRAYQAGMLGADLDGIYKPKP